MKKPLGARLPEMHALLRSKIKSVAGLNAHRRIPSVDIAHRAVDAEFGRTVRIGKNALARGFLARLVAPNLGVAEEQPLIAAETIEHRGVFSLQRQMVGG